MQENKGWCFRYLWLLEKADLSYLEIRRPVLHGIKCELQPVSDSDLFIDTVHVFFHGWFTDVETCHDILVAVSIANAVNNLRLTPGLGGGVSNFL